MKNTVKSLQSALQNGRTLKDVAEHLASGYNTLGEDMPIVKILNDLGIAVFVANMGTLRYYCHGVDIPNRLKCYTVRGKELKRLHGKEFAAAVGMHLSVSEQRFWLAYCLGCILIGRWIQNVHWVEETKEPVEDDMCRKFAFQLLLPYTQSQQGGHYVS